MVTKVMHHEENVTFMHPETGEDTSIGVAFNFYKSQNDDGSMREDYEILGVEQQTGPDDQIFVCTLEIEDAIIKALELKRAKYLRNRN
jgi:hypothetical protein